jgi:hypothetical protein
MWIVEIERRMWIEEIERRIWIEEIERMDVDRGDGENSCE